MNRSGSQAGRKRRWFCAVYVACLFCLVAIAGRAWRGWRFERRGVERPARSNLETRPGINVDLAQYDADELDAVLTDAASLGFHWLRQRFPWQDIERTPGAYDWERWDARVEAVRRHRLGLIAVLDTPPDWALRRGKVPLPCDPPSEADAYGRFVSAFAGRYGEWIDHYQVWDEPNLSRSWGGGHVKPCGYAVLLEAAHTAVHAADPTAFVLGGGLAPTQAPGPDDLNDLTYLGQLYAAGGGSYFDILAVKPYGFWSGPGDRRVASDVLNFSRVVALREMMRSRGEGEKPVWAVEWGWNVLPDGWEGEQPPWGSDSLAVQRGRVLGVVSRVRAEWPWLGVMAWAEYQPDVPSTSPRWGFALLDGDGSPTGMHGVLAEANRRELSGGSDPLSAPERWGLLAALLALAVAVVVVLWSRCGYSAASRRIWERWAGLHPSYHLCVLLGLAALYGLTIPPEWVALELALATAVFLVHPLWALFGTVLGMPFSYYAKPIGGLAVPPSETFLWLAMVAIAFRRWRAGRALALEGGWSVLDQVWVLWILLGALSVRAAPEPALAAREWRLCMLDPALLYFLLRLEGETTGSDQRRLADRARSPPMTGEPDRDVRQGLVLAWILSGATVALVGIGQWMTGVLVHADNVGRVVGVYYSPNHLALYLERVGPVALALGGAVGGRWRRTAWGAAGVIGIALYLTYSRGAWLLAVPVALLVLGLSYRRRVRWWAAAGALIGLSAAVTSVLHGRWRPIGELLDTVRIPVWQSTVAMIADHPWLGVGLDGFRFVYPRYMSAEVWTEPLLYHPHNLWLDAAVRTGIPGAVLFAVLVACCLRGANRLRREARRAGGARGKVQEAIAVGCLAALAAGMAHGMVDSGYFLVDLAWSLALVAGVVSSGRQTASCGDEAAGCAGVPPRAESRVR